jgi:hypothetical protein
MTANLRSAKSAAERLGVSVKTLNGYVRDGELRYILVGSGKKKPVQGEYPSFVGWLCWLVFRLRAGGCDGEYL